MIDESGETRSCVWEPAERRTILADREGGPVEKKTFDMTVRADRDALHAEASILAKEKGIDTSSAMALLADRVRYGPPARLPIDTRDPTVREALATEARRRIELSRVESITRHGDEREKTDFSVALYRVMEDVEAGKEVPGIKAEVQS